jgi:hypothetical protein
MAPRYVHRNVVKNLYSQIISNGEYNVLGETCCGLNHESMEDGGEKKSV